MILNPEPDDFFYGEADLEQASLDAAGRVHAARQARMRRYLDNGDLTNAARACGHSGSGYPLSSPAAHNANDPRAGSYGFRCTDCGSHLDCDPWDADDGGPHVLHPCEIKS